MEKDYNHPSVVLYSIGNEVSETAQPRGIELTGNMRDWLHELDNRPVTCGINIFFNYLSSMGFGVYSNDKAKKETETVAPDGLCYVRLKYTDEEGEVKPLARGDIHVTVQGGTLLGLGSACPYNERGYLTDTTDTYYGEALAIVKPDGAGTVTVRGESPFGSAQAEMLCRA